MSLRFVRLGFDIRFPQPSRRDIPQTAHEKESSSARHGDGRRFVFLFQSKQGRSRRNGRGVGHRNLFQLQCPEASLRRFRTCRVSGHSKGYLGGGLQYLFKPFRKAVPSHGKCRSADHEEGVRDVGPTIRGNVTIFL